MAVSFTQGVIRVEKLAVFCASEEVNEWQIRGFFLENWKLLRSNLDNGTILFIAGVHGKADGELAEDADSLETMIRQFNVEAMKPVRDEMEERNIRAEFLQIQNFLLVGDNKDIDKDNLIAVIRAISPQMVVMVVCYSQILDLKFLLEESGIFSEVRLNRDLCIQSRGKILTMSKVQKEFLQTMAKPENITKKLVQIEGQVGSGKTLLGIEVVKMKIAHYLRFYKLNAYQGKEEIRVIIVIEDDLSADIKTNLEKELFEDIDKQSSVEIHNQWLREEGTLKKIIETPKDFARFKKTIILVDECHFHHMDNYKVKNLDTKIQIDYIHCIRYADLGINSQILEEKVQVDQKIIFVTLLQIQRSSQPILELLYFINGHEKYPNVIPDIPTSKNSFPGPKPQWVEVKDANAFVKYAEENLPEFKGEAMIIRDYRNEELPEISSLCSKLKWKHCYEYEVRGSESSLVIIYDFQIFHFEAFTRAKHNLLIVTLSNGR